MFSRQRKKLQAENTFSRRMPSAVGNNREFTSEGHEGDHK
jgi:hypothetical protein